MRATREAAAWRVFASCKDVFDRFDKVRPESAQQGCCNLVPDESTEPFDGRAIPPDPRGEISVGRDNFYFQ
jgi:hypothetical protein